MTHIIIKRTSNMRKVYCALVYEKDETGSYMVQFPDIPTCITEGKSIEEVKYMAEDALGLVVSVMQERKMPLPEPTLDEKKLLAMANKEDGAVAFILPVSVYPASKTIQIALTGPEDKLEMIKEFAKSCGMTRSAFMVEASMEKIARMKRGE